MLEKELSFADLPISLSELYEAMGYADAVPDEAVKKQKRGEVTASTRSSTPRTSFSTASSGTASAYPIAS